MRPDMSSCPPRSSWDSPSTTTDRDALPVGRKKCSDVLRRRAVRSPENRLRPGSPARWRAFPARPVLTAATAAITADQGITGCPDTECVLCRDAIAGGPEAQEPDRVPAG
ncbi:hypothetical protein E1285_41540 [Actinomadura sp. 7K507]|nr:hypothetical protein E1285_41540 [Actinomadura sp. 7K507]